MPADFVKGASGPAQVYDTSPSGLGIVPAYLAPGGTGAASSNLYRDYTPTWTSSGTAPAIGNAVVIARYIQIGKMVHAHGRITFGTTSTFGTGNYTFALPVTSSTQDDLFGTYFGYDLSAGAWVQGATRLSSTTTMGFNYAATHLGTVTLIGQLTPWTWANTDQIGWNITYEAA